LPEFVASAQDRLFQLSGQLLVGHEEFDGFHEGVDAFHRGEDIVPHGLDDGALPLAQRAVLEVGDGSQPQTYLHWI